MQGEQKKHQVSLLRLRIGILLLILWWLPIYLTVPTITHLLNLSHSAHTERKVLIIVIITQTILGILGLLFVGKELAFTLKNVRYKKLPITIWRIVWSGNQEIDPSYLKVKKQKLTKPA